MGVGNLKLISVDPTMSTSVFFQCLEQEALSINASAKRVDPDHVEKALSILLDCRAKKSKLVVTGVGKSGLVGRKISATFASVGLNSIFLSPVDALHGDLGMVYSGDVVLALSNSGETAEVNALIPHFKSRGNRIIALVGRPGSTLGNSCDVLLNGSVDREVCPLNLAPTASTAVAMAIGDALAVIFMSRSGISQDDFAANHPAGALGRRLTLTVAQLMVPVSQVPALAPNDSLIDVVNSLTRVVDGKGSLGAAWVQKFDNSDEISGLITDGDLRRILKRLPPNDWIHVSAGEMATAQPITVIPEMLAAEALNLMESNSRQSISVVPVVKRMHSKRIVGLLRLHDLVQAGLA